MLPGFPCLSPNDVHLAVTRKAFHLNSNSALPSYTVFLPSPGSIAAKTPTKPTDEFGAHICSHFFTAAHGVFGGICLMVVYSSYLDSAWIGQIGLKESESVQFLLNGPNRHSRCIFIKNQSWIRFWQSSLLVCPNSEKSGRLFWRSDCVLLHAGICETRCPVIFLYDKDHLDW